MSSHEITTRWVPNNRTPILAFLASSFYPPKKWKISYRKDNSDLAVCKSNQISEVRNQISSQKRFLTNPALIIGSQRWANRKHSHHTLIVLRRVVRDVWFMWFMWLIWFVCSGDIFLGKARRGWRQSLIRGVWHIHSKDTWVRPVKEVRGWPPPQQASKNTGLFHATGEAVDMKDDFGCDLSSWYCWPHFQCLIARKNCVGRGEKRSNDGLVPYDLSHYHASTCHMSRALMVPCSCQTGRGAAIIWVRQATG